MALSTEQQMLVEQRLANEKKSAVVSYLLWFLLGGFGAHRFYLGKTNTALIMLALWIIGWVTLAVYIGGILLLAVAVWLLVDAFLIPGMVEADSQTKRAQIANEISIMTGKA